MKFRAGDELLSMAVLLDAEDHSNSFVFTVTDGGFAKRTPVEAYRQQGRGGLGIKAMRLNEDRGSLVGGLIVAEADEVIAIKMSGQITRSLVSEVAVKGRDTMGVKFVGVRGDDTVAAIALYPESEVEVVEDAELESDEAVDTTSQDMVDPEADGTVESNTTADPVDDVTQEDGDE